MARRAARGPAHVVLLTHAGDDDVPARVADAIGARGGSSTRIDTDRLPLTDALAFSTDGALGPEAAVRALWIGARDDVDLARASAVWCRRLWPAAAGTGAAPPYHAWAAHQARDALFGALAALTALRERVRVVNDPHAQLRAEHKALQLAVAARVGLAMPPTVVTNDPATARAFVRAQRATGGGVVTKLLVPLSQSMRGDGPTVPTTLLTRRDDDALDALRPAPQIFQRAVKKAADARVVIVGARAFAGALEARARDPIDWRALDRRRAWRATRVPPQTLAAARRLVRALALDTGALDFVVDARGRWHFLEVNPAGEWGFLEDDLGAPIADAFAELLCR